MNKKIDEMARVYEEARMKANETMGSMNEGAGVWYAKAFYEAGYRKQSEVAREIFAEIEKCFCGRLIWCPEETILDEVMFTELKEKYGV